ncbi:A-type inclusion protein/fusion peptide hybrid [Orf virus]|uniref:A-type inclusion protein/fusion peptide hybrid n=1 Tax=Orf virus TaxID=10258 RepID=A0A0R8IDQ2_ORFV|nr:A-type inclusion protein/fusion peptide hybrid [Orf virus]
MESDDALVARFKSLVERHWHQSLRSVSCIPREDRKLIRDIIRRYIQLAPAIDGANVAGRPLNLYFRRYVERNPMYRKIFVDDEWLSKNAITLGEHVKLNVIHISTLGKLYLMIVKKIMTGHVTVTNEPIMDMYDVHERSPSQVIDRKTAFFCQDFLSAMGTLAHWYSNPAIYFGVPMYWWYGVDAKSIYRILETGWTYNGKIHEETRNSLAFIQFMSEVNGNDVRDKDHVKVVFEKLHKFQFVMSVPEFIMDGLCFTAWDTFSKVGTSFTMDIFIRPSEHDGAVYKSVDHDEQGDLEQLTRPNTIDCSAVRISYYPDVIHVSNDENDLTKPGAYDLYYYEHGDPNNISRNYYERRDRLTYDGRCGEHRRVWTHPDPDGTTYLRMLWDRYDGNIKVTPFRVGFDGSACVLPERVDKLLAPLEKTLAEAKTCCESNRAAGRHLEKHIETMRQYAVLVSNKTDVHTCRRPGAEVTRHALDGSLPPPHVLGDWGARSYCGRQRNPPRVSHGEKPWWWGQHAAIW